MKRILVFGLWLAAAGNLMAAATLTTLHTFTGVDGSAPEAGLVRGTNGNFYGTTVNGGTSANCIDGCGTVFEISPSGAFTSLHSFTNFDGEAPRGALVQGSDGNLYGTTFAGGVPGPGGGGTVFRITASGVLTTIHSSAIDSGCGVGPESVLLEGSDGNFYGTTYFTMYRITTNGVCTELNVMLGGGKAGLVFGTNGNLYGTTQGGGTSTNCSFGCGSVIMITPNGVLTRLHSFDRSDGQEPLGELVLGDDGNFYGTTSGSPLGALNCANGCGTVFRISPDGVFTNLHTFASPEGKLPLAGLVQGSDGNFYGTCSRGGQFAFGTAFQITTNGVLTRLVSFGGAIGVGAYPVAPLLQGSDGAFYGTTQVGGSGTNAVGTVFKLTITTNSSATISCVLSPTLASNTVNTAHTVVATVTSNGVAKSGLLVNFNVFGANAGQTGTATTSASGLGTFTYTGTSVGTDTLRAIAGGATGTATKVWIAAGCPTITVSPATLPDGTVGVAYNQTITANGTAPRTFAVAVGTLPDGLTLANAGTLSGTPVTNGASGFTVTVTDANDCTGNRAYTLTVNEAPPELHDLAVVKMKAPKKINFSGTPVTGKFAVTIQNNATHDEVIPDFATLQELVTVSVQSLSNCASFAATMTLPKKAFPLTLAPKKKLKLAFTGTFNCVNDPLPSSKTAAHPDYRTIATVDLGALGEADTTPANDACPHNPFGLDKGCGNKTPAGTFGADVLTDIVVK